LKTGSFSSTEDDSSYIHVSLTFVFASIPYPDKKLSAKLFTTFGVYELKKVYLSGPIMDEVEGEAREWREQAKQLLGDHFKLLDPMRRNFKDREVDSANEIVEFDLQDVRDGDIILVNYNKPSIGTSMEVFYAAHDLGKFVIAFSPFSYKNCSPWMVRYCTKIHPSLETACEYLVTNFAGDESD